MTAPAKQFVLLWGGLEAELRKTKTDRRSLRGPSDHGCDQHVGRKSSTFRFPGRDIGNRDDSGEGRRHCFLGSRKGFGDLFGEPP